MHTARRGANGASVVHLLPAFSKLAFRRRMSNRFFYSLKEAVERKRVVVDAEGLASSGGVYSWEGPEGTPISVAKRDWSAWAVNSAPFVA
eukprot:4299190-Prymnesium_polylepis.2